MKKSERKTNSKLVLTSILTLAFLAILGFLIYGLLRGADTPTPVSGERTVLDSEYINTDSGQIEMSKLDEDVSNILEDLISEKKSFVVYVSLPVCSGITAEFKEYVRQFQKKERVSFYYLTSDYVKDTSIYQTVKYFPSVIIYNKGEISTYLKFNSNEDSEYFKSLDGFSKWFKANVEL